MSTKGIYILIAMLVALLGSGLILLGCTQRISRPIEPEAVTPTSEQRAPVPAKPDTSEEQELLVTVTGRLCLVGSEPFDFVALDTPEGKNYGVTGKYMEFLREQASKGNVVVRVKGYLAKNTTIDVQDYEVLHLPDGGVLSIRLEYFKRNGKVGGQVSKIEFAHAHYLTEEGKIVPNSLVKELCEIIDGLYQDWVQADLVSAPPSHYYLSLQILRPLSGDEHVSLWLLPNSETTDGLPSRWMIRRWERSKIVSSSELSLLLQQLLGTLGLSMDDLIISSPG